MAGWDACHGGTNRDASGALVRRRERDAAADRLAEVVDAFVRGQSSRDELHRANKAFIEARAAVNA